MQSKEAKEALLFVSTGLGVSIGPRNRAFGPRIRFEIYAGRSHTYRIVVSTLCIHQI